MLLPSIIKTYCPEQLFATVLCSSGLPEILTLPLLSGPGGPRRHTASHIHLGDGPRWHRGRRPRRRRDGAVSFGDHSRGREESPEVTLEGKTFRFPVLNQRRQGGFTRTSSTVEDLPGKQYSGQRCVNVLNTVGNPLHDGASKSSSPGHMGNPQAVPQNKMPRDLSVYTGKFSGLDLAGGISTTICSLLAGLPFCVKFFIRSYLSAITS